MNKNKVLYVGRLTYGKVFKLCNNKAEALEFHFESVRKGTEIKSFATFPMVEPIVRIDYLSYADMTDQLPH